jgi:PIN domain nuclease of toxin-antitoxin system
VKKGQRLLFRDSASHRDRIIVGAARRMNAKLLTRDKQITNSGIVTTVW